MSLNVQHFKLYSTNFSKLINYANNTQHLIIGCCGHFQLTAKIIHFFMMNLSIKFHIYLYYARLSGFNILFTTYASNRQYFMGANEGK
jgi:hypothetical protein